MDITQLTLREKVGQTMLFGFRGEGVEQAYTYNFHAKTCIEELGCGGIVLFTRNIQTPEQTRELCEIMQEAAKPPLFIAVDQEGGIVNRFRSPLTEFPGNMALGATASEQFAFDQFAAMRNEIISLGFNWNFAPVADVNCNPNNPVIGTRSFGDNPEMVGKLATAASKGLQSAGVLSCAKHFPGHGDTSVDSHYGLPKVDFPIERLEQIELAPFKKLCDEKVTALMTAHMIFSAIDSENPATLSYKILTELVREKWLYEGLIITDCLSMKAIADNMGSEEAAIRCFEAGADIALVCHDMKTQVSVFDAVLAAYESSRLSEEKLNKSVERILRAKSAFKPTPPLEQENWTAHKALKKQICQASVTYVGSSTTLPLDDDMQIVLLGFHSSAAVLNQKLIDRHLDVQFFDLSGNAGREIIGEKGEQPQDIPKNRLSLSQLKRSLGEADVVLVATALQETKNRSEQVMNEQKSLLETVISSRPDTILVALREPYDMQQLIGIKCMITGYSYTPAALEAVAEFLVGNIQANGVCPVKLA